MCNKQMIIFDACKTLIDYLPKDNIRGRESLMSYLSTIDTAKLLMKLSVLFEVDISKSGLKPEDIWYVGDKIKVDVAGSQAVGMTPVLFKNKRNTYGEISYNLIVIKEYSELTALLQKIK